MIKNKNNFGTVKEVLEGASNKYAKILATENITIVRKKAETAAFDPKNRVLYLPIFSNAGSELDNMFILHEVGHALFTPHGDYLETCKKHDVHPGALNVTEDIRIEAGIARKFLGSKSIFYHGRREMYASGMFGDLKDPKVIATLTPMDRINIRAKLPGIVDIPLTPEEERIYKLAVAAVTFEDAVEVAKLLAKRQEEEESPKKGKGKEKAKGERCPGDQPGDNETDGEADVEITDGDDDETGDRETDSDIITKAEKDFLKKQFNATRDDYVSIELPRLACRDDDFSSEKVLYIEQHIKAYNDTFWKPTTQLARRMAQRFIQIQSAHNLAKNTTAKTGIIDVNKMYKYKFTDDIFKRLGIESNMKNHGLFLLIDMSGSMRTKEKFGELWTWVSTLVQFCRYTQIPYEVYGFTTAQAYFNDRPAMDKYMSECLFDTYPILASEFGSGSLMKVACDSWDLKKTQKALSYATRIYYGNTPLTTSLIHSLPKIKAFRQRTKKEIVNLIIITDGGCTNSYRHVSKKDGSPKGTYNEGDVANKYYVIDRETKLSVTSDELPGFQLNELMIQLCLNIIKKEFHSNNAWVFLESYPNAFKKMLSVCPEDNRKDGVFISPKTVAMIDRFVYVNRPRESSPAQEVGARLQAMAEKTRQHTVLVNSLAEFINSGVKLF